jgi:NAD(P)-dependent dehydrogenase (short-subunit alcohol dehydrogenase family)
MKTEPTIQQLFNLRGKTALITGATGHLGRSLATALAEAGANLIVTSRDESKAREVAAALPAVGGARHHGLQIDQLDDAALADQFTAAVALAGSIDILVNNGNEACKTDLTDCQAEEFNRQLSNATGYFLLARLVHDHAVARGKPASIIMLGSMYGLVGSYPDAYKDIAIASPVAYHALKGSILQMTRHLAVYWARDHVRVNALSPGPFPGQEASAPLVERLCTKSPMGRMGQPHELKGAIVFLASDASSYMTGQNLVIDGGWTAW